MDLKVLDSIKVENPYFNNQGFIKWDHDEIRFIPKDEEKKSRIFTVDEIVMIALIARRKFESIEDLEGIEFNDPIELKGELKYDENSNSLYWEVSIDKSTKELYPMTDEEVLSLKYYITKVKGLCDKSIYIKDLIDHIEEAYDELFKIINYEFTKVIPESDGYLDWMNEKYHLVVTPSKHRYASYPSWVEKYFNDLRVELDSELHNMGYDEEYRYSEYIIVMASYGIFGTSFVPSYIRSFDWLDKILTKFTPELSNTAFGDRIPPSGPSKDMAAELVSSLNYIIYRWYNDGDNAEDLWNQTSAITFANVHRYLTNRLRSLDSFIFRVFFEAVSESIYRRGVNVDTTENLSDLVASSEFRNLPSVDKEILDKIISGSFTEDDFDSMGNDYRWVDEYIDCCDGNLSEAMVLLITLGIILKVYPNYLKGYRVEDLRSKYIGSY